MAWTTEQVLALAPDASSAKAGKDLSAPRKWKTLGANAACAWGTFQGSGKDPYQVSIDFSGPAFKCSCPSRKFPCKHGMGLLLIVAAQPGTLAENQPPAWTAEWLARRSEQEQKKKSPAAAQDADPEAQARAAAAAEKRAASREARVTAGIADLRLWLRDLVRAGFASLPGNPSGFWETPASRMVDAQAPGLGRRLRELDGITTTGEQWPAHLLRKCSLVHLAAEAWGRVGTLALEAQADLRTALGFTVGQETVLLQTGVEDRWLVMASRIEADDSLRVQRTWLFGTQSRRLALSLSFSAGPNQPLDITLVPGTMIEAELVFFPGAWPQRALVKRRAEAPNPCSRPLLPHATVAEAVAASSQAFSANPWLERVPFGLATVLPLRRDGGWILRDQAMDFVPLSVPETTGWVLLALSGGAPLAVTGEWDGERFVPLGAWEGEAFVAL
jgi:hypothetical protein